jgi:hypothetical protein
MPIPPKKVINADAGTTDIVGGNDWDDMVDHLANMNREPYTWYIYKDASNYKAKNGSTGVITYTNTDFKTLFQAVIDTIPVRDDTVFTKIKIGTGVYDVNSGINVADKYNLIIEGSGMEATRIQAGPTNPATDPVIIFQGTVSGTQKNLTANTVVKAKTVTMSSGDAATFAAGDYVLVRATDNFGSGGSASGARGEIKRVQSVSGSTVTFREPLFDQYTTAFTANCIKILFSKNITISDLSFTKHASYTPTNHIWVHLRFVDNVNWNRVLIRDWVGQYGGALLMRSCLHVRVSDSHLRQDIEYNFQYGFTFENCCQDCTISNCTAYGDMRHHFEVGSGSGGTNNEGICRNITVTGCTASGGSQNPFDTHPEGEGINFINCGVLGVNLAGGIKIRSRHSAAIGCFVRSVSATDGQGAIRIDDDGFDCAIQDCSIVECAGEGIQIANGCDGARITGNLIKNNSGNGIAIKTGGAFRTMISNNVITGNGDDGINALDMDSALITGNRISNSGGWGINFEAGNCTNNVITSNSFASNASGAVNNGAQSGNKEANNVGWT